MPNLTCYSAGVGKSKKAKKSAEVSAGTKAEPKGKKGGKVAKLPKKKCCLDTPRCGRCPIRMLKEGTLPDGYTVKKRRLVKVEPAVKNPKRKRDLVA